MAVPVHMHVFVYMPVNAHVHVPVNICVHVCMYACVCACACMCVCVPMSVYTKFSQNITCLQKSVAITMNSHVHAFKHIATHFC